MTAHDALSATRDGYDAAAATYAELFRDSLRDSPPTAGGPTTSPRC